MARLFSRLKGSIFTWLILLSLPYHLYSQNLVPNPSFESYITLPCEYNAKYVQELLDQWFQPITTSTDYWNSDSPDTCYLNPTSVGTQARSGNGMAGIITADIIHNFGNPFRFTYQEYLGVKLTTPFNKKGFYHAQLYAKARQNYNPQIPVLTANNLGLAFTDYSIFYDQTMDFPNHLTLKPQVEGKNIIGFNWEKIEGCFIAEKAFDYLYIGNFRNIDSTQIQGMLTGSQEAFAYYFIDDVLVEELPYDVSSIPDGAAICYDDGFVELNAYVKGATAYKWQDGSTNPKMKVFVGDTSKYFVDIYFTESVYRHQFNIEQIPKINLGPDTVLCVGEQLILRNNFPDLDISWWDGSKDSEKWITSTGHYSASATTETCQLTDTISVFFEDCPGFVPNVITPNDDRYNDYLVFQNIRDQKWTLKVINRWGEQGLSLKNTRMIGMVATCPPEFITLG